MADVSTVLEKDTPDVIVRRENEAESRGPQGGSEGTKGGQNHKNPLKISREEKWSWKRREVLLKNILNLYREDQSDEVSPRSL